MKFNLNVLRKWSRIIHRDASFFFSGMLLIYAISGIVMNHRDAINPNFSIERREYRVDQTFSIQRKCSKENVLLLLKPLGEEKNYTKHYFPQKDILKVFLKGGSNLLVNVETGNAVYEAVTKRHVIGGMTRLHYNPGKWWTVFADLFAIGLIVIVFTGIVLVKGKKGIWGRGGVELLLGILIPLCFLFFF